MRPINEIAATLGIDSENLEAYGKYKAKVNLKYLDALPKRKDSKLILVTAISPTPAGEGKTTTTVGLGDALRHIGKNAMIALREPSLGPVFGMKGGATGGGLAQVVPSEEINLHFTGDFNAIACANNLLAALLDNHIHHGNELAIDIRRVTWKRVIDMNDRALREIIQSLGGVGNGYPRSDGFDIVVASEIMAIFCLATSIEDLKGRIGRIVVGYRSDKTPVLASDLKAQGAMTVILKDAFQPNLVQSLENTPAFIHGGPFANIAHGCNSVVATTSAMKLADYVVTEAGFGADLGAEKFINIKCRKSGLRPSACVLVATVRAIKYHGGADLKNITTENLAALEAGIVNLERHIKNITSVYNLPLVVSINHFTSDTKAEIDLLQSRVESLGVKIVLATHWADGGGGAADLAHAVVELCEQPEQMKFVYEDGQSLWEKVTAVATKIYGAKQVTADAKVVNQLKEFEASGYGHFPICVAKTQYSFTTDSSLRGAPSDHTINIREVRLSAGAEFIVMICGDVMTMPGLPKNPAAERIDYVDGKVIGIF
ncbi:MAG: formate--tetrahydrofolate ligase [Actinobacteria bacterium]|nr:formate--tetrahydrofolate ligase [Actinomycetota bacterium]